MYRQGDILIAPAVINAKDAEIVTGENGRLILARGEATGHHHSVAAKSARLYRTATAGIMLLEVLRRVQLKHQEHAPITLPPGSYLVKRQREYTSEGEQRWVAD